MLVFTPPLPSNSFLSFVIALPVSEFEPDLYLIAVVGASTPSVAKWVFAIICYVAAGVQVLGFIGVWKERPIMYRRYATLHLLITIAAFSVAAVWIIISAVRHNQAKAKCESDFFANSTTSEGDTLCEIFPWVDVGIMGGLWVLLAIVQFYLYIVVSSYGSGQRLDHEKYDSMYDPTKPLTSDIPLSNRADPWEARPSSQALMRDAGGYHTRQSSMASVSTVMADRPQHPVDFGGYDQAAYPPSFPGQVHAAQDPGPTPLAGSYNGSAYTGMEAPARSQPHPAEGSFRRKTPRLQKPLSEDFEIRSYYANRPAY
ncbi:unnamed protein product [Somion occarium]|uniref:Uncharacterized protein n=1 Tax=Somion occarium TaxID=3059160 RepID=A0ABP1CIC6_9APHY